MERLELEVNLREATGKSGGAQAARRGRQFPPSCTAAARISIALSVDDARAGLGAAPRNQPDHRPEGRGRVRRPPGPAEGLPARSAVPARGALRLLRGRHQADDRRPGARCSWSASPQGVEQQGGVLDVVQREVEVKCLPLSIPDSLSIDVSELDIGDALHVSDLVLPEGVVLLMTDPEQTLVHVTAPRVVEEEPERKRRPRLSRVWPSRARPPRRAMPRRRQARG